MYRGKTGTTQLIKITKRLTKHIFDYKHKFHGQVSNQHGTRKHPPYTKTGCFMMSFTHAKSVTKRFVNISKVVGRKIKPKDMRTSSLSHRANDIGIVNTAKLAGHKRVKTTEMFYAKASHAVDNDGDVDVHDVHDDSGDEDNKNAA